MKKFIALIACLILVVYAGINKEVISLNVEGFGMNVSIEAGSNEAKEVQTVEELSDVLQSLVARLSDGSTSTASATAALADEEGGASEKEEYTDAILTFKTESHVSMTMEGQKFSMDMERTMKCLFTEDAAYYYCDAEMTMSGSGQSIYADIVMELFLMEEESVVRFTEMEMLMNGQIAPLSALCNKWIRLTEALDTFTSVNDQNYAVMEVIGDCIEVNKEKLKGGANKVFTLEDAECKTLCLDLFEVSLGTSVGELTALGESLKNYSFTADLSDETKPTMTFAYAFDLEGSTGNERLNIQISEINRGNKVKLPSGEQIYDLDELENGIGMEF
ncbi:MAG: hypothetical protein IJX96_04490 [Clostridia bacterium]|nr:hypothetical protein [Clostridia bacterium]